LFTVDVAIDIHSLDGRTIAVPGRDDLLRNSKGVDAQVRLIPQLALTLSTPQA
jgi:hypothetical protein